MTTELAVRTMDIDIADLKQIGAILAESGYFNSDNARASAAQLMVKVLAGRELGYGPWASAAGIHIIKGKMTVSANLMADAVKRSGRYDYRIREMSDKKVAIEFFAIEAGKRESLGVSEFTYEDGRKAGTQNLDKFPRNMLFARAMSNGVKWFTPDVFSGNAVYVPEEMGANVDGDGNVIDAPKTVNVTTGEVTYAPTQAAPDGTAEREFLDAAKARKRFMAIGSKNFGTDWDGARRWMLHRYSTKRTPDRVREHTSEMTPAELSEIADTMDKWNGQLVKQYQDFMLEEMRKADAIAAEIIATPAPDDNPFEGGAS